METLKLNVFNFLNKSKKTTVPLVLLCPTFPSEVGNRYFENSVATAIAICWK